MRKWIVLAVFLVVPCVVFGGMRFMLYGFKIGQSMDMVRTELGQPQEVYELGGGVTAYVYILRDHAVVFSTDSSRPDLVFAIQLQGRANPPHRGLGDVNLGDDVARVVRVLGKPDDVRRAIDQKTEREVPGVEYYDYHGRGNYSLEVRNGRVTSIKISYAGGRGLGSADEEFYRFLMAVKGRRYYDVGSYLTASTVVRWDGKYEIKGSVLGFLLENRKMYDVFFRTIASFERRDVREVSFRVAVGDNEEDMVVGKVFKIEKHRVRYEILFVPSFDGWVVWSIEKLD